MRIQFVAVVAASAVALGLTDNVAFAESSIFELRITNNTDRALTFRLHDGQSKHARLVHDGNKVSEYTIPAGSYDVVGVQATGSKCSPNCGGCSPTVGKVYAYYFDDKGDEQRNNYYEPSVEFFEYCGFAGTKSITTYTSNWAFDHGTGKGTGKFKHSQKASNNSYTKSDPAQGLTVDGKYISGHATISYNNSN